MKNPSLPRESGMARRKTDWLKRVSVIVAVGLGLVQLTRAVVEVGRGVERLETLNESMDQVLVMLAQHTAELQAADADRSRVEAKVQIVAEALAARNKWSNRASDDIVRRLDALNHKGTQVLENRP